MRLPRSRSLRDPNSPEDQITRLQVGTNLNHRLNADWTLRHRFLFGRLKTDEVFVNPAPAFGDALRTDGRTLEPVHNFRSNSVKNARWTNCRLVLILRSQFFHKRRHFSSQPKERSTTQRWGNTAKVCSSVRLTTCTLA